jgi:VWFA-related protein
MLPPLLAARRVVAAGLSLSMLAAPSPGQSGPAAPAPVLEITTVTRVVDVYATVKDAKGRLVTSLGRDRFDLREDGVPQTVDYFAHETDAPLSLGLVVDTSASQAEVLPAEREEARRFLRTVLGASDQAFVLRFDREVVLLQGLTNEIPLLTRAIDVLRADPGPGLTPAGSSENRRPRGTRLYDAIDQASGLLGGQKGRKVLVLLTDGEDQVSRVTLGAALEAAQRAEVAVYSVSSPTRPSTGSVAGTSRGRRR